MGTLRMSIRWDADFSSLFENQRFMLGNETDAKELITQKYTKTTFQGLPLPNLINQPNKWSDPYQGGPKCLVLGVIH